MLATLAALVLAFAPRPFALGPIEDATVLRGVSPAVGVVTVRLERHADGALGGWWLRDDDGVAHALRGAVDPGPGGARGPTATLASDGAKVAGALGGGPWTLPTGAVDLRPVARDGHVAVLGRHASRTVGKCALDVAWPELVGLRDPHAETIANARIDHRLDGWVREDACAGAGHATLEAAATLTGNVLAVHITAGDAGTRRELDALDLDLATGDALAPEVVGDRTDGPASLAAHGRAAVTERHLTATRKATGTSDVAVGRTCAIDVAYLAIADVPAAVATRLDARLERDARALAGSACPYGGADVTRTVKVLYDRHGLLSWESVLVAGRGDYAETHVTGHVEDLATGRPVLAGDLVEAWRWIELAVAMRPTIAAHDGRDPVRLERDVATFAAEPGADALELVPAGLVRLVDDAPDDPHELPVAPWRLIARIAPRGGKVALIAEAARVETNAACDRIQAMGRADTALTLGDERWIAGACIVDDERAWAVLRAAARKAQRVLLVDEDGATLVGPQRGAPASVAVTPLARPEDAAPAATVVVDGATSVVEARDGALVTHR